MDELLSLCWLNGWVMGAAAPMAPPKKANAKRRKQRNSIKQLRRKRKGMKEEKATRAAVN